VFRLTGLLHDPAPEVRGAAAVALLRTGGEAMFPNFSSSTRKGPAAGRVRGEGNLGL